MLDVDNVRHGLCGDLSFSPEARVENIHRVGEVAKYFMEAGVIVLTAFNRADRERVRGMVERGDFIETYCDSTIEICESRDVKGYIKDRGQDRYLNLPAPHRLMKHPKARNSSSTQALRN